MQRENPNNEKAFKRKREKKKLDRAKEILEILAFEHSNLVRPRDLCDLHDLRLTKHSQTHPP